MLIRLLSTTLITEANHTALSFHYVVIYGWICHFISVSTQRHRIYTLTCAR